VIFNTGAPLTLILTYMYLILHYVQKLWYELDFLIQWFFIHMKYCFPYCIPTLSHDFIEFILHYVT
jgi:hypothetical protein